MPRRRSSNSSYWRVDNLRGLHLLQAEYGVRSSARHTHEGYEIALIEAGELLVRTKGATYVAGPGAIVVINPGETHAEGSGRGAGWTMRAFYPRLDDMRDAITGVRASATPEPFFAQPIIDDPQLGAALRVLHRSLERPGHALEQETRSIHAAALLAMRHGRPASSRPKLRGNAVAVRRAAEYIEAHHGTNVSLTELAALTELSPFHLVYLFNAAFGMPPHAYLTNVRLGKARALLAAGVPAARAAVEVGFTDQSHLHRRFRRAYGITPGQFVTATKTSNTR